MPSSASRGLLAALCLGVTAGGACLAAAPEGFHRQTEQDAGVDPVFDPDASSGSGSKLDVVTDPHAVLGADPAHGPWNGGQRVLVRGNGFSSKVRVWFGETEVDAASIVPVDPTRVQVNVPPGIAGPVEIRAQNGDDGSTLRALPGGYTYDKFYAVPAEGPVSGGTVIELIGQGTAWDASTTVTIDQKPCSALTLDSPTLISCTVPQGTPGSKPIAVTSGAEPIVVLDGYTYEDSDNGYKGGLSGAPLAGKLKILVYDNISGNAVPGAYGIVGTDEATALTGQTDTSGLLVFDDASLVGPRTVTVAAKCMSPISFVDVPVDTVTVYLDPVVSPECAAGGDPPVVGGKVQYAGTVYGELVWEGGAEFKKAPWVNVPNPKGDNERAAAYVFVASADPGAAFSLPSQYTAVYPTTLGGAGYQFTLGVSAGNRALYALAGIEDRQASPAKFTAYAFGLVRGVPVVPGGITEDVYIPMMKTLDKGVTWDVQAPAPGPKGPDRLRSTVALMLGNDGFAILPTGQKAPLLPLSASLTFWGVPSLDGDLLGATYLSTARAVTGPSFTAPMSVLARVVTHNANQIVPVNGFVGVPTLSTPAVNAAWDGRHLATTFGTGSPIDLSVYDIAAESGLMHWTVVVPKGSHAIDLPSLAGLEQAGLPAGPITIGVYGARVEGFDYANVRYRDLRPQGMSAYSLDYFPTHL